MGMGQGTGLQLVEGGFVDGAQVFFEKGDFGVGARLLTIAPATITIGSSTQDTDFVIWLGSNDVTFDAGAGTMTLTGVTAALGAVSMTGLDFSAAAADITVAANTIAALEFFDATTKFFVFDTRTTVTGVANITATGIPATIVAASGVTHNLVSLAAGITTLTGSTGVTAMQGLALTVAQPTITGAGTPAVALASTVYIAAEPVATGTATITAAYALYVASGNSLFAGDIFAGNAAGPAFINEAATSTNPTLCPNKAEEDTGIGWASDVIHITLGGTSEYSFSTSTLDMNTNTITDVGDIETTNAAGPTLQNEAATTTNPTLIPNRVEEDTGIGWASDTLHIVLGGVDEYSFSTTTFDMNGNTITEAGTIDLDGNLDMSSQASDLIVIADTDSALEVNDGTTQFLDIDTRVTVSAVANMTLTGMPATIVAANGVTHQLLALVPGTTTLTGSTAVNAMNGLGLSVAQPTITGAGTPATAVASTVYIAAAPLAGGTATITAGYALHVAAGTSLFSGLIQSDLAGEGYSHTGTHGGAATINAMSLNITDASAFAAGNYGRALYINYNNTGVKSTANAEGNGIGVDINASANVTSLYGVSLYTGAMNGATINRSAALAVYNDTITGTVSAASCLYLGMNGGATVDDFIAIRSFTGTQDAIISDRSGGATATNLLWLQGLNAPAYAGGAGTATMSGGWVYLLVDINGQAYKIPCSITITNA